MMLSKFLDPKNDIAFKKIFGSEKNKDILIHFLNDLLIFDPKKAIVDVTILKTSQDPDTAAKKTSYVDVLCTDQKGNAYIVEMQVAKEKGFIKRAQYYASKAYVSQILVGGRYYQLKEVIFLAIVDAVIFAEKPYYKSDHVILDKESYEQDLKDFSFTFLELPKFNKPLDQLKNNIEKWCYFFKYAEETTENEAIKLIGQDKIIERALDELNRFSWSDEELRIYEQSEKAANAYLASLEQKYDEGMEKGEQLGLEKGEKLGLEKGEKLGLEKGEKLGLEKGEKLGLEKGERLGQAKGEKVKALQIAETLLQKGLSLSSICEITGLLASEIHALSCVEAQPTALVDMGMDEQETELSLY